MAHFVAFVISFQKIIPSKNSTWGGGEQGLLVAQGLIDYIEKMDNHASRVIPLCFSSPKSIKFELSVL